VVGYRAMRQKKAVIFISLLVLTLVFSFQPGFALALTYDPYDNQPKYPEAYDKEKVKKSDSLYNILSFYTLPFKFADKGIEKILDWAERTHFPRKVKWLWQDVLHENGIYPEARFSAKTLSVGGGGTLKLEKMLGFESQLPYLKIHGGGGANSSGDTDVNSMIELSQQEGFKFYSRNLFGLSHLNNETFWGLGPRSSIAEGVEYEMTTLTLKNQTGFKPFQGVDLGGGRFFTGILPFRIPMIEMSLILMIDLILAHFPVLTEV